MDGIEFNEIRKGSLDFWTHCSNCGKGASFVIVLGEVSLRICMSCAADLLEKMKAELK